MGWLTGWHAIAEYLKRKRLGRQKVARPPARPCLRVNFMPQKLPPHFFALMAQYLLTLNQHIELSEKRSLPTGRVTALRSELDEWMEKRNGKR
jgi:hypothetical protein